MRPPRLSGPRAAGEEGARELKQRVVGFDTVEQRSDEAPAKKKSLPPALQKFGVAEESE